MILYFDTLITDSPLFPNKKVDDLMKLIRPANSIYKNQTKAKIFQYTLESFLDLKFDKISVNVEFENHQDQISFNDFFAGNSSLNILNKRSISKKDYLEKLSNFEDDEWCFFSPNNDHPFISNDPEILNRLEKQADLVATKYDTNVTIFYSHYSEYLNILKPCKYLHSFSFNNVSILDETDDCFVVKFPNIQFVSIQIIKISFLRELLMKVPDNFARLIRLEDIGKYVNHSIPIISLIPKNEICRHFDTYVHTIFHYWRYIKPSIVPPLFIPPGFFESEIKIKFGYNTVDKNFLNINPNKSSYSFQDQSNGFDLLCKLDDIPLSWHKRISQIDKCENFNLDIQYIKRIDKFKNPWGDLNFIQIFYYKLIRNIFSFKIYQFYLYLFNKIFWDLKIKNVLK